MVDLLASPPLSKGLISKLPQCLLLFLTNGFFNLGGPEFCNGDLHSNFTFGNGVHPVINVTLCGVPAPVVQWRLHDGANDLAKMIKLNNYTYGYLMQLAKLTQKTCGRDLILKAIGYNVTERKSKVFLSSCKY